MNKYEKVKQYIIDNFDKTVRLNQEDKDSIIGLPYKYTVPCIKGMFNEMYYWDTYFTNKGLLLSNKVQFRIFELFFLGKYLLQHYSCVIL